MKQRTLADKMRDYAEEAAKKVREEYQHELNFTETSIWGVEAILKQLAKDLELEPVAWNITLLFGAYVGELIRLKYRSAFWDRRGDVTGGFNNPYLVVDGERIFPLEWCQEQMDNPDSSIVQRYFALIV